MLLIPRHWLSVQRITMLRSHMDLDSPYHIHWSLAKHAPAGTVGFVLLSLRCLGRHRQNLTREKLVLRPYQVYPNLQEELWSQWYKRQGVCADTQRQTVLWCPFYDFLCLVSCKGEDPEGSWASLDCCWTISFLMAAVRAEAVPHRVKAEHPPDCAWLQHLLLRSPICLPYNWSIAKAKLSKRCPSNDGNYMIN